MLRIIGRPSSRALRKLLQNNLLPGCDLTPMDVKTADHLCGLDVGSLKGMTVHRDIPIVKPTISPIPVDTMKRYQQVTLAMDVMFINKLNSSLLLQGILNSTWWK